MAALPLGAFTDDTAMALCPGRQPRHDGHLLRQRPGGAVPEVVPPRPVVLLRAVLRHRQYDPRRALERFETTAHTCADNAADPNTHGSGSIMRLAPVPLAYAADPKRAIELAAASSCVTHAAGPCVDACRYLAALLVDARPHGRPRERADRAVFEYLARDRHLEAAAACA